MISTSPAGPADAGVDEGAPTGGVVAVEVADGDVAVGNSDPYVQAVSELFELNDIQP